MDLAGGLSRCQPDNCEKILAAALASRYFSIQFFASLRKWIGARNPVKIGSSCAAVTGYNFPWANRPPKAFGGGEGGKKGETRSQNICPVYLIRARVCGARKNFFAKRRMRVVTMRLRQTSPPLKKWRKTCYVEAKWPRALARWDLVNDCATDQPRAGTIAYCFAGRSSGRGNRRVCNTL